MKKSLEFYELWSEREAKIVDSFYVILVHECPLCRIEWINFLLFDTIWFSSIRILGVCLIWWMFRVKLIRFLLTVDTRKSFTLKISMKISYWAVSKQSVWICLPSFVLQTFIVLAYCNQSVETMSQEWVKLNVGGLIYHTTRTTLLKDESSMLSRMFSQLGDKMSPGRLDENSCYLIDRLVVPFLCSHVLNVSFAGTEDISNRY